MSDRMQCEMRWISGACGISNINAFGEVSPKAPKPPEAPAKRDPEKMPRLTMSAHGELGSFTPPGGCYWGFANFSKSAYSYERSKKMYAALAERYKIVYQSPPRANDWHPEYGVGSFFVIYDMDPDSKEKGLEPNWPFEGPEDDE